MVDLAEAWHEDVCWYLFAGENVREGWAQVSQGLVGVNY